MSDKFLDTASKGEALCPDLDTKTRIIGFIISLTIGCLISFSSLALLITGKQFATLILTAGNCCLLAATFFLVGPKKQFRNMIKPVRAMVSFFMIASIIGTIILSFIGSSILRIICIIIQYFFVFWYVITYIPGAEKCCKQCMPSWIACCCNENDEEEEQQAPVI